MSENVLTPGRSAEEPLAGEVAVDPATGRPAGRAQALVLLFSSCLAVLGAVLLAPVLPRIEDAFAGTAGVKALTPIVLTAPALVIGLTATVRRPHRRPARPQAAARRRARRLRVRRHRAAVAAVAAADRRQPRARRAHRGRDHDLLHDAAGRLLPRLAARAVLRPAGRLHDGRRHDLLRRRRRAGRAELAHAVLALRGQPAAGVARRALRLAARAAGARPPRAPRSCPRCRGARSPRRSASRCSAVWSSTC